MLFPDLYFAIPGSCLATSIFEGKTLSSEKIVVIGVSAGGVDVGHAFSPETMFGAQSETLEQALWSAMKTLEESARLAKKLADTERLRGHDWMAVRFEERERDARERADTIRRVLLRDTSEVPSVEPNVAERTQ
jgi:hypothetical protein